MLSLQKVNLNSKPYGFDKALGLSDNLNKEFFPSVPISNREIERETKYLILIIDIGVNDGLVIGSLVSNKHLFPVHHRHLEYLIFWLFSISAKWSYLFIVTFSIPFIPSIRELVEVNLDRKLFLIVVKITIDYDASIPFSLKS